MSKASDMETLAKSLEKSFGKDAVAIGGLSRALRSIPTGSLALDYELGIGGWPLGYLVGVFGQRDIGKSSILGFNAIKNAQAMGLNCAIIAVEPNFDEAWAAKNGIDVSKLLLTYPMSGEEAFALLHKILRSKLVDFVLFDSVGALVSEVETKEDGKPRQGGQAGLITWGVKTAAPIAYRNEVCVMMINQIRDDMKAMYAGMVKQPGGHALEHHESIIVQLKRGGDRYTVKRNGVDIQVGQQIIAHILRNKMTEGSGQRAVFDYFSAETEEYPFGIDVTGDVVNTAKRLGVIQQSTSWFTLPNGQKFNGLKAVGDFFSENPNELTVVREIVLRKMVERASSFLEVSEQLVEEMAKSDDLED